MHSQALQRTKQGVNSPEVLKLFDTNKPVSSQYGMPVEFPYSDRHLEMLCSDRKGVTGHTVLARKIPPICIWSDGCCRDRSQTAPRNNVKANCWHLSSVTKNESEVSSLWRWTGIQTGKRSGYCRCPESSIIAGTLWHWQCWMGEDPCPVWIPDSFRIGHESSNERWRNTDSTSWCDIKWMVAE